MAAVSLQWQGIPHPVIGMVHEPPLPGSPRYQGDWSAIESRVLSDVESLAAGGVDGLMLENFGDAPFLPDQLPPITVACLTKLACAIARRTSLPFGINALRNDGRTALAVAVASGASFIRVNVLSGARVTDQGLILGQAHVLLRERAALGATDIRILADVDVKHSAPLALRSLTEETHDLVLRSGADAVIVSGPATGQPVIVAELTEVQAAACGRPVFIGSGVTAKMVAELLPHCQGLIVGSGLKPNGDPSQPVDRRLVTEFMAAVRRP